MINGISSLVQGEHSRAVVGRVALFHAVGGATGGASMAGICWLVLTPIRTILPSAIALGLLVCLAVCTALSDFGLLSLQGQNRQVPQRWLSTYGVEKAYGLYGFWLGAGLATNVAYALEYVVFIGAAILLPLFPALVAGAIFGLCRTAVAGPVGVVPRAAWAWTEFFRTQRGRLPALSGLIALGLALAMVLVYLSSY
jgi:hypothetical protein